MDINIVGMACGMNHSLACSGKTNWARIFKSPLQWRAVANAKLRAA